MPLLAARHRVIAVDLRGMGASQRPQGGYDKRTMAADLAALVARLGHRRVDVVGHDIGSMVAFSFAANHPETTRRAVMLDALHPDERFLRVPLLPRPGEGFNYWWYAFNQVRGLPEELVAGRVRHLMDWFYAAAGVGLDRVSDFDRSVYARSYDAPDAIRASNGWYQAFYQDIEDIKGYPRLVPPLLGVASEQSHAEFQEVLPALAEDVRVVKLAHTVHYLPEEAPQELDRLLSGFLS
jgi:pimeloyl-ACP methyl ester carboxylesterase